MIDWNWIVTTLGVLGFLTFVWAKSCDSAQNGLDQIRRAEACARQCAELDARWVRSKTDDLAGTLHACVCDNGTEVKP